MKPILLRLHRWLAIAFAVPLIVVVATGLILSVEPWLVGRSIEPATLDAGRIEALLARHDPAGQARGIAHRSYDHALTIGGGRGGGLMVDTRTGERIGERSRLAGLLSTSRGLHETLLLDASWLVITATAAMLAIILMGVLMGLPQIANTMAGWHKAIAWGLLPLLILSPLTGLLLAGGVTFTTAPSGGQRQAQTPLSLVQAVRIVGRDHDLSSLVWLRQRGNNMLARLVEDGEYRVYAVTADGAMPTGRNWPRLWHEGNFAGGWSAAMNLVISLAMGALLVTGLWIWLRRTMRLRRRRAEAAVAS